MARYTKTETIEKLKNIKISEIYNSAVINYKGLTTDTKEKYTEVVAKELLDNPSKYNFDSIEKINRNRGYNVGTHDGTYNDESNRREEIIAVKMYSNKYPSIGKMLDYQVPLKDKKSTKAGKIDLISYNDDDKKLYLIELKNDASVETLLRCVLEIVTYERQINKEKLVKDFNLDSEVEVVPAILIFEGTRPYEDRNDLYVNKLIKKYNIEVFIAKSKEVFTIDKI